MEKTKQNKELASDEPQAYHHGVLVPVPKPAKRK
jgi:hypothetical protein